jgi:C-terminal processing protease CtpA/Prc
MVYGKKENFLVSYKQPGAACKSSSLPAATRNEHVCTGYTVPERDRLLNLEYPNENVAVLTIATFNDELLKVAKLNFSSFLDSAFSSIKQKGISKLIVDLRGNGGGADAYGASLYSFLTPKPFQYYKQLITVQRKLTVADHPGLGLQQPGNNTFDGKVFVLINGMSFSATTEFCAVAKSNRRAVFIGEETGGTYVGNTSGKFVERLLPNTQIKISVPTIQYVMAVKNEKLKNRGIIPDHIVMPTINDVLGNKDVQLEYAINLAGR